MPVSLVLRPYVQELQAAAGAHVKQEAPADSVTIGDGENCCMLAKPTLLRNTVHGRQAQAIQALQDGSTQLHLRRDVLAQDSLPQNL